MKALGAVPATLTMGETYDALRSGIVDAFVGLLEAGHSNKLYEVAPYFTHYPYANIGQMVIINNDSYASLTDAQRAIFDEAVERIYFESVVSFMGWSGIPAVEDYQADGYEEITMTDAEIAKFGAALSTLLDDYAATIDNGQEVKELLLKLAAENNAKYPTDPAEK
ncbi:MAG: hypothetical protein LBN36_00770, partial [Clostridiales Family XIII bacterium]|jgi:TRAP-type C4-dicarboxylate transport system substrate-binding protein|nr:hypothetical protein [Clostridiales Family XIII bacterium]